jgi:hypothetical protein
MKRLAAAALLLAAVLIPSPPAGSGELEELGLAIGAGTVGVYGPDGQRVGTVRENPGGSVDLFGRDGQRLGWGRTSGGTTEFFDTRGNRIGTARDGRITVAPRGGGAAGKGGRR